MWIQSVFVTAPLFSQGIEQWGPDVMIAGMLKISWVILQARKATEGQAKQASGLCGAGAAQNESF